MAETRMPEAGTNLVILRSARKLQHYLGSALKNTYPVAVGKPSTPTPLGNYKVVNKILNPGDILGTRWMGLDVPGGNYGIHGTNNPSSIGKFISHGCIRMQNYNVEELFPQVNIGTPVTITDEAAAPGSEGGGNIPGGKVHVVQPGDTLWKISILYGVPVEQLIRANKIADPTLLEVGQVIIIP
ncbi:MAG: L,D-transpeptidase family protein [Actinobacteria bacterium]|nr:L,D-transpeptidase family protein [Actinomycetota bacterium]